MKQVINNSITKKVLSIMLMLLTIIIFVSCGPKIAKLKETIVTPKGTTSGVPSANGKFYTDYGTFAEQQEAAKNLSIQIAEEGNVLLKNANNALPLSKDERNVSLFGVRSVNLQTGGGGSGAGTTGANSIKHDTLISSMKDADFKINEKLVSLYEQQKALGITSEIPMTEYPNSVTSTYYGYNDAAIITFSRTGSEDIDLKTYGVAGHANQENHYLMLDDNEKELIKHTKKYFDKVIVIINSSNIMEIPELHADKTDDNYGVDAILWVGHVGNNGAKAIGRILNGTVNPSGRTVDIWPSNFKNDPTWTNFGDNKQNVDAQGNRINNSLYLGDEELAYYSVEYREGVYVGYKYYETVASELNKAKKGTGNTWYQENVVYPFGYGLSYSTFKWELDKSVATKAAITNAHETVTLKIKVTNTGSVAGKDVVQVYASAPYTKGGIEKPSANLVAFGKTNLLQPNESEVVTLQFVAQDMASFDYNDKNANGFKGYELESGTYKINIGRNSHDETLSVNRTIKTGFKVEKDYITGNTVTPVFNGEGKLSAYNTSSDTLEANKITRTDLKQPTPVSKEDRTITQSYKNYLDNQRNYYSYQDKASDVWYVNSVPASWTQTTQHAADYSNVKTKLSDMIGIPYNDRTITDGVVSNPTDENTKKWDEFMNQLTWDELKTIVSKGNRSQAAIPSIGKDGYNEYDGPAQIRGGSYWPTAVVISSTWNVDLAHDMGRMVGNESIFTGVYGWYAPSMNTHRSPFGGRNFEYYSEDGVHAGLIAAAVVKGAVSKGTVVYIKHMFLNDQEKWRSLNGGVSTWADEQVIREIYAKPFELAIKLGGANGIMTAFNRIGDVSGSVNYALHEELLRKEWGFVGVTVTDAWADSYRPMNLMMRTGQDLALGDGSVGTYRLEGSWDATKKMVVVAANETATTETLESPTHYFSVRRAAQRILYNNVNSAANKNAIAKDYVVNVDVQQGVANTIQINIDPKVFGSSDIVATLKQGTTLPAGLTLKGIVLSGTPTDSVGATFEVELDLLVDGWVKTNAILKINLISAIQYEGSNLLDAKIGTAFSGQFSSQYYAYENIDSGRKIVNWYMVGTEVFVGNEHWSSEDIKTIDPNDPRITEKNLYGYSIKTGVLPSGLTMDNTGKITGTPTTAGTYEITVEIKAPWTAFYAPWINPKWGKGIYYYARTVTIVVK